MIMNEQINVNDFKPGITFLKNDEVYLVLESFHSKSGRGQAHVRAKVKNLFKNSTLFFTFTGGEKVEKAFVKKEEVQFLYSDEKYSYFMNMNNFEQFEIDIKKIEDKKIFLIEGLRVNILFYNNRFLDIEIPKNITLKVIETTDAVKGDTVNKATKKAILENNLKIDVPQFVNINDKVVINTESLKYISKG